MPLEQKNTASAKFLVLLGGITSNVVGVVADGVSSAKISVILPSIKDKTVYLKDDATILTVASSNGIASFTYTPDLNALGLTPSNIPKDGHKVLLKAVTDDKEFSASLELIIYRKPVLLIHGLWSSADVWNKMVPWLKRDGFAVYTLDYGQDNADDPRDIAKRYLVGKIKSIKEDYLLYNSINCSKIDVIGHSMGGIVARCYMTTWKEGECDISKLITVGTPHLGSPAPQAFYDAIQQGGVKGAILRFIIKTWIPWMRDGPALNALKLGSEFLNWLNARALA
jgi:pimeloyl-ACP methyl ester carboxylesterase